MKKIISLLLALALVLSCTAAAFAFTDVSDADTAAAAEVLRLMGVIDGYEDGTFRPNRGLSRAEFCKMAVYALGQQDAAAGYRTSTIFPDVKPSSWYAPYVNLCAKNSMIAGFPNGYFQPDSGLTVGQAAAILLRSMEKIDPSQFPSWPLSYMVEADRIGLLEGTGISPTAAEGNRAISRSEAARMFVAALKNGFGGYKDAGESSISSIDAGTGKVKMSGGVEYEMAKPFKTTALMSTKGTVLLSDDGKFVTLLPESTAGSGIVNAAVIVAKNGSTDGFSTLSDGKTYKIYKNGVQISASDIKKGDVATYSASTGSINLCDTRVSVYYEGCDPNPDNPATITILNGTKFTVLDSAKADIAKYKPGDEFTLMFTDNGQVAGVTDMAPKNMAIVGGGYSVDKDGEPVYKTSTSLFCGSKMIPTNVVAIKNIGDLVSVSSYAASGRNLDRPYKVSVSPYINKTGNFDPVRRIVGDEPLSSNARIFNNGVLTSSNDLGNKIILEDDVRYVKRNENGTIDMVIISGQQETSVYYGRARFNQEDRKLTIQTAGGEIGPYATAYIVKSGEYIGAKSVSKIIGTDAAYTIPAVDENGNKIYQTDDKGNYLLDDYGNKIPVMALSIGSSSDVYFIEIDTLAELKNVNKSSIVDKKIVTYGSQTYSISEDIQCFNKDSQSWVTLDEAMVYSDTYTLYASEDSVIRILEVKR